MKLLVLAILSLTLHVAYADQGDSCAKVFLDHGSRASKDRLVQWCNQNQITDAHAEVAEFYKKDGSDWSIEDLMLWAKEEKLTSAHVTCGILYNELGAWKGEEYRTARLLKHCRNEGYTKKDVSCARKKQPVSVDQLNKDLKKCQKKNKKKNKTS